MYKTYREATVFSQRNDARKKFRGEAHNRGCRHGIDLGRLRADVDYMASIGGGLVVATGTTPQTPTKPIGGAR